MSRIFSLLLTFCILMMSYAALADSPPSDGAKGMAGAKGTFSFEPSDWKGKGQTTWWKDSDGIDPGVAGCHIGTDSGGKANGRKFGEACMADGLLVESNPGANVVHKHTDDTGHPDKFDCNAWCKGNGRAKGMCKAVKGPAPCAKSAMCSCN
jgi:hypothetical protein